MNVAFTICSANYLSTAISLRNSFYNYNENAKFYIILADRLPDFIEDKEIIEVEKIGISKDVFNNLLVEYNLIEFNTAIKPFAINYLIEVKKASKVIYLDPDILVFNSLSVIYNELDSFDFVLTPHLIDPVEISSNYHLLLSTISTGVFNLGFIALSINEDSKKIINWWQNHLIKYGHNAILNGEFYDQKVMNLLPVFSNKTLISKDYGRNVAEWNLHERILTENNNQFLVNGHPLLFFHFSSVKITSFDDNRKKNRQINSYESKTLHKLINLYIDLNIKNNFSKLNVLNCVFNLKPNIHRASRKEILKYKIRKLLKKNNL